MITSRLEGSEVMNELRLENIHAAYRKKEVLRGVTLSVRQGEIVALIGPNGAGKSTLLKVAAGFLKPLNGHVWLDGKEVTALAPHERVGLGLAYFMQGGKVFPSLTVAENLELGVMKLSSEDKEKSISTVLGIFSNLRNMLDKRAGLLSGGERQALALAMILVQNPKIILLDEPSAGLAPKLAQDILNRVRQLNQRLGITVLLVEQRVREALQVAHRALALTNGTLAAETDEPACWLNEGALDPFFFGRIEQPAENSMEVLKQ
jgi:branched-chain amino acid transport system ATP-binding protein